MSRWWNLLISAAAGVALLVGCATPQAVLALQQERVRLGHTSAAVIAQTGPPDLWIAKKRVETLYYKNGDRAVYISFLNDRVIAYDDRGSWPELAAEATGGADKPVSTGRIRVGMPEVTVRQIMGNPTGITAKNGLETLHWVSDDESDSTVELWGGRVVGYADVATNEYSQNIPSHNRKKSTTGGMVRVGMAKAAVQARLGRPDSVSARRGQVIHKYDSNAVFSNDLVYKVKYRQGRVVGFSQRNKTRAKDQQEAREEAAQERAAAESGGSMVGSIFGRVFDFLLNPAVIQALSQEASGGSSGGSSGGPRLVRQKSTVNKQPLRMEKDSCGCSVIPCEPGSIVRVNPCSARCINKRAVCRCNGYCRDGNVQRQHSCSCR